MKGGWVDRETKTRMYLNAVTELPHLFSQNFEDDILHEQEIHLMNPYLYLYYYTKNKTTRPRHKHTLLTGVNI